MSQNPNDPNYNPYGPNPTNPNYPGSPGTAYGGPQPPSGPNSGYNAPYPPANPPSGPNPNTPNSSYGQNPYNPYAPPPPGPSTGPNPYTNPPVSNPYDPYAPTAMSQQASSPSYPNPASSPGYTSYPQPGMMGTVPPPMAPMGAPRKRGNGTTILISVIVLIVVIGGIVFGAIAYNNNQTATKNNHLTATAQANITATSQVQATASAVANTYPFSAKLLVSDPMVDNSKGMNWEVNQQNGCFFSGSAYHVFDSDAHTFGTCASLNKDLTDYTFEAAMVITQATGDGDGGGLIFRADEQNTKLYRVTVDQNGVYRILIYVDEKGTTSRILKEDTVPSFNTGLQQSNVLSIVVRGDQISFYVNRQKVTTVTDSTYTHGQIGFDVTNHQSGKTEVAFTNVKVWDLS